MLWLGESIGKQGRLDANGYRRVVFQKACAAAFCGCAAGSVLWRGSGSGSKPARERSAEQRRAEGRRGGGQECPPHKSLSHTRFSRCSSSRGGKDHSTRG